MQLFNEKNVIIADKNMMLSPAQQVATTLDTLKTSIKVTVHTSGDLLAKKNVPKPMKQKDH